MGIEQRIKEGTKKPHGDLTSLMAAIARIGSKQDDVIAAVSDSNLPSNFQVDVKPLMDLKPISEATARIEQLATQMTKTPQASTQTVLKSIENVTTQLSNVDAAQ